MPGIRHLDALLKELGAAYYQTLHGDAAASDVAHAIASVEAVETARPPANPRFPRGDSAGPGSGRSKT